MSDDNTPYLSKPPNYRYAIGNYGNLGGLEEYGIGDLKGTSHRHGPTYFGAEYGRETETVVRELYLKEVHEEVGKMVEDIHNKMEAEILNRSRELALGKSRNNVNINYVATTPISFVIHKGDPVSLEPRKNVMVRVVEVKRPGKANKEAMVEISQCNASNGVDFIYMDNNQCIELSKKLGDMGFMSKVCTDNYKNYEGSYGIHEVGSSDFSDMIAKEKKGSWV